MIPAALFAMLAIIHSTSVGNFSMIECLFTPLASEGVACDAGGAPGMCSSCASAVMPGVLRDLGYQSGKNFKVDVCVHAIPARALMRTRMMCSREKTSPHSHPFVYRLRARSTTRAMARLR